MKQVTKTLEEKILPRKKEHMKEKTKEKILPQKKEHIQTKKKTLSLKKKRVVAESEEKMLRTKKKHVIIQSEENVNHESMHEKNKITIDVKKYWLEEIALLLGEFYRAHDDFHNQNQHSC